MNDKLVKITLCVNMIFMVAMFFYIIWSMAIIKDLKQEYREYVAEEVVSFLEQFDVEIIEN